MRLKICCKKINIKEVGKWQNNFGTVYYIKSGSGCNGKLLRQRGKAQYNYCRMAGTINSKPPMVSISIRKERYSYNLIKEKGQFVINLTTRKLAFAADFAV